MTQILPTKGTLESIVLGFDFSAEATSVSSPVMDVSVEVSANGDPNPSSILVGSPAIDSSNAARVLQRVAAGLTSTSYRLQCTVQTDAGDTLTLPAILPVAARL